MNVGVARSQLESAIYRQAGIFIEALSHFDHGEMGMSVGILWIQLQDFVQSHLRRQ